jgi:hypothetical protein
MNPHPDMSSRTEHDPPENLLGPNRRIALLARISARQKAIAREVREDQAMGAKPVRSLRDHNIAHPEHPGHDAFDAQCLAVSYGRHHAPAARLKPDLMAAGEQSPAQLLK